MKNQMLVTLFALLVPLAGAMGYVHGTFATIERVKTVDKRVDKSELVISRIDRLICKIAINQKLKNAVEICTNPLNKE